MNESNETDMHDLLKRELPSLLHEDEGFKMEIIQALEELILTKDDYAKMMDAFLKIKNDLLTKLAEIEDLLNSLSSRVESLEKTVNMHSSDITALKKEITSLRTIASEAKKELDELKMATKVPVTEEVYVEKIKEEISRSLGTSLREWRVYDNKGIVYGHPATVEALVAVKQLTHFVIKIQPVIRPSDIGELKKIGALYEEKLNVKPRLIIVGHHASEETKNLARELGVEVRVIAI